MKNTNTKKGQKIYKCEKCGKNFSRNYTLQKHYVKKIPCNRTLKCVRCNKVFKTKRDLERHMNRKYPCKTINNKELLLEKEIEILNIKKDIALKKYEKELEIYEKKIKLKLEVDKERMLFKKELSKIVVQGNENKTNQTTNNINIVNGINIDKPTYNINVFNMENITNHIEKNILTLGIDAFGNLIEGCPDVKQKIIKILELTYNNKDFPECKNLMYSGTCDKFFSLEEDKRWKETSYEDVKPIVMNSLRKVILPYMDDFKQNGSFIMNSRDMMVADKNMTLHFKLSDCNTYIKNSDKTNKTKKEIREIIKTGLD